MIGKGCPTKDDILNTRHIAQSLFLAGTAILLAACSRKPTEFETSFVDGCAANAARSVCQCTFDAVHKHYGDKGMAEINEGKVPEDFAVALGGAMEQCSGR